MPDRRSKRRKRSRSHNRISRDQFDSQKPASKSTRSFQQRRSPSHSQSRRKMNRTNHQESKNSATHLVNNNNNNKPKTANNYKRNNRVNKSASGVSSISTRFKSSKASPSTTSRNSFGGQQLSDGLQPHGAVMLNNISDMNSRGYLITSNKSKDNFYPGKCPQNNNVMVKVIALSVVTPRYRATLANYSIRIMRFICEKPICSTFPKIYEIFLIRNCYYLFMNLTKPISLYDIIGSKFKIPQTKMLKWSKQMTNGICVLQKYGIAHRFLKLKHLVISNHNLLIVGWSKAVPFWDSNKEKALLQQKEVRCPRNNFLPPEAFQSEYDPSKADVWAIGITMVAMATQRYPFRVNSSVSFPTQWRRFCRAHKMNPKMQSLCNRIFKPDPKERALPRAILNDELFTQSTVSNTSNIVKSSCSSTRGLISNASSKPISRPSTRLSQNSNSSKKSKNSASPSWWRGLQNRSQNFSSQLKSKHRSGLSRISGFRSEPYRSTLKSGESFRSCPSNPQYYRTPKSHSSFGAMVSMKTSGSLKGSNTKFAQITKMTKSKQKLKQAGGVGTTPQAYPPATSLEGFSAAPYGMSPGFQEIPSAQKVVTQGTPKASSQPKVPGMVRGMVPPKAAQAKALPTTATPQKVSSQPKVIAPKKATSQPKIQNPIQPFPGKQPKQSAGPLKQKSAPKVPSKGKLKKVCGPPPLTQPKGSVGKQQPAMQGTKQVPKLDKKSAAKVKGKLAPKIDKVMREDILKELGDDPDEKEDGGEDEEAEAGEEEGADEEQEEGDAGEDVAEENDAEAETEDELYDPEEAADKANPEEADGEDQGKAVEDAAEVDENETDTDLNKNAEEEEGEDGEEEEGEDEEAGNEETDAEE